MISLKIGDGASQTPDEPAEGWRWPTDFRKFMGWIFLATCLQYLTISLRNIPFTNQPYYVVPLLQRMLTAPVISIVMAVLSVIAWWTIWKGKSSAKVWAIATSIIYILLFVRQFIIPLRPVRGHQAGALVLGIIGLVAFLWRDKQVGA